MALEIKFELGDSDLAHFRALFERGREKAPDLDVGQIVRQTRRLLESSLAEQPPEFVRKRLEGLGKLIAMLEDEAWLLPEQEREQILAALTYFVMADDVIPDSIPVLGLLDDAIAAELALRSLQHEIEAYDEFTQFRAAEAQRHANADKATDVSKEDWLADRRSTLHSRMRERRLADPAGWHSITLFGI
jgi:uncharacterized membrane protein YkvA (DUF1232 family)